MSDKQHVPALAVRLKPDLKLALQQAAKDDVRTVSSLVQKILTDWLKTHGYL